MYVDPNKVFFESNTDLVNYVAQGLAGSKKNFAAFMDGIDKAITHDPSAPNWFGPYVTFNLSPDELTEILRTVHKEKVKTRNRYGIIIGIMTVLLGISTIQGISKDHKIDSLEAKIDAFDLKSLE